MKNILVYNSGGGLGDSIQLFPLLISLKGHFKKTKFFYLGAHKNHFVGKLKEYNITIETLDLGLNILVLGGGTYYLQKKNISKISENLI